MMCVVTALVAGFDFGPGGAGTPSGTLGQWERGVPTGETEPVWATRLDDLTLNDADELLTFDLPDLSGQAHPIVVVDHAVSLGSGDRAVFELSDGGVVQTLTPLGGYGSSSDGYRGGRPRQRVGLDLQGVTAGAQLRLRFIADSAGTGPGWTVFGVQVFDGDPLPPIVRVLASPSNNQQVDQPQRYEVDVIESGVVLEARVESTVDGQLQSVPLQVNGDRYVAELGPLPSGTDVTGEVVVSDCERSTRVALPSYRVALASPGALTGVSEGRPVSTQASLVWEAPMGPWPVLDYRLLRFDEGGAVADERVTTDRFAQMPLSVDDTQRFAVSARYDVNGEQVEGDFTDTVELAIEVPAVTRVEPAVVAPGEERYLLVEGENLYLDDDVVRADFGVGVQVTEIEVVDVERARIRVEVADVAAIGPRDLSLTGGHGTHRFRSVLNVEPASLPAEITTIVPPSLEQSQQIDLTLTANVPFGEPVVAQVPEGLLLTSDIVVDGNQLRFRLAALSNAAPGEREILVDDGDRILRATIRLRAFVGETNTCSNLGFRGLWVPVILLVSVLRRRKQTGQGTIRP